MARLFFPRPTAGPRYTSNSRPFSTITSTGAFSMISIQWALSLSSGTTMARSLLTTGNRGRGWKAGVSTDSPRMALKLSSAMYTGPGTSQTFSTSGCT